MKRAAVCFITAYGEKSPSHSMRPNREISAVYASVWDIPLQLCESGALGKEECGSLVTMFRECEKEIMSRVFHPFTQNARSGAPVVVGVRAQAVVRVGRSGAKKVGSGSVVRTRCVMSPLGRQRIGAPH